MDDSGHLVHKILIQQEHKIITEDELEERYFIFSLYENVKQLIRLAGGMPDKPSVICWSARSTDSPIGVMDARLPAPTNVLESHTRVVMPVHRYSGVVSKSNSTSHAG